MICCSCYIELKEGDAYYKSGKEEIFCQVCKAEHFKLGDKYYADYPKEGMKIPGSTEGMEIGRLITVQDYIDYLVKFWDIKHSVLIENRYKSGKVILVIPGEFPLTGEEIKERMQDHISFAIDLEIVMGNHVIIEREQVLTPDKKSWYRRIWDKVRGKNETN